MVPKEISHLKTGDSEPTFPNDGKLQLLSMRFCPYAQRIHLVLEAKNIPYHTFNINLTDKPEWLKKYSPLGKVPALGLTNEPGKPFIHESLVIADYLDEKYPEKLLYPKDPLAKAIDRLLIEQFNGVTNAFYRAVSDPSNPSGITDFANGLDAFDAELKKRGTAFFGGSKPGMLDFMIWPWVERISVLKRIGFVLDKARYGRFIDWTVKMSADPTVKVYLIAPEIHDKYVESRIAGAIKYDLLV